MAKFEIEKYESAYTDLMAQNQATKDGLKTLIAENEAKIETVREPMKAASRVGDKKAFENYSHDYDMAISSLNLLRAELAEVEETPVITEEAFNQIAATMNAEFLAYDDELSKKIVKLLDDIVKYYQEISDLNGRKGQLINNYERYALKKRFTTPNGVDGKCQFLERIVSPNIGGTIADVRDKMV